LEEGCEPYSWPWEVQSAFEEIIIDCRGQCEAWRAIGTRHHHLLRLGVSLFAVRRRSHHLLEEVVALFQVLVSILCVFIDVLQLP
jgi:hypothetical protein